MVRVMRVFLCIQDNHPRYHGQHQPQRHEQKDIRDFHEAVQLSAQHQLERQLENHDHEEISSPFFAHSHLNPGKSIDQRYNQIEDSAQVQQPYRRKYRKPRPFQRTVQP